MIPKPGDLYMGTNGVTYWVKEVWHFGANTSVSMARVGETATRIITHADSLGRFFKIEPTVQVEESFY